MVNDVPTALITERKNCRICGSTELTQILSLGDQYTSNFVTEDIEKGLRGPLELVLCERSRGGCGLVQLRHTFNHDVLYKQYWYRSGISPTMVKALNDIVARAEDLVHLNYPHTIPFKAPLNV